MPINNQDADKHERRRLLYAQQKDIINARRRLLYKNRNNPTTSSTSLPTSNAVPTIQTNPSHLHQIQYNLPLMKNTVAFEKGLMNFLACMFAQYAKKHTQE